MKAHEPTFTQAQWLGMHRQWVSGVGLYCSCGWVFGVGNRLGCERAFDRHLLDEMGIESRDNVVPDRAGR